MYLNKQLIKINMEIEQTHNLHCKIKNLMLLIVPNKQSVSMSCTLQNKSIHNCRSIRIIVSNLICK